MKRQISLFLATVMLLAIFPFNMISVSAATHSNNAYLLLDFEDGEVSSANSPSFALNSHLKTYAASVVNDGVGSSSKAMSVSLYTDQSGPIYNVALRKGYTYDISFWIKAKEDMKTDTVSMIFSQPAKDTTLGASPLYTVTMALDGGKLTNGEWVYASATIEDFNGLGVGYYDADGDGTKERHSDIELQETGEMIIRIGDGLVSSITSDGSVDFLIDDLTVMPTKAVYRKQTQSAGGVSGMNFYYFKGLKAVTSTANADGWYGDYCTTTLTATTGNDITINGVPNEPLGGTGGGYITITTEGQYGNLGALARSDVDIRFGIAYDFYFWAKAETDETVGLVPQILIDLYQNNDTTGAGLKYHYPTILSVKDNTGTYSNTGDFGLTKEWRQYHAYFSDNRITNNTKNAAYISYRLKNGFSGAKWSMGNFKIFTNSDATVYSLNPKANMKTVQTGANKYRVNYSSTVSAGSVTECLTRIMEPYKDRYAIIKTARDWSNSGYIDISTDDASKYKMLVNPTDHRGNFGEQAEYFSKEVGGAGLTMITELDQPVWAPDMTELSATVMYNAPTGNETLMALYGLYDNNNKMIFGNSSSFDLNQGEGSVRLAIPTSSDAVTAKVYLWEAGNHTPIQENVTTVTKTTNANFVYVDYEKGTDSAAGGYLTPVKSLETALNRYENLLYTSTFTDTYIVLMPSRHERSKQFTLNQAYTSDRYNLTFTSYNKNDKAVISGGIDLTGQFSPWQGGIYRAKIDAGLQSRELYVNDAKATKARTEMWPDNYINTSKYGPSLELLEPSHVETTDLSVLNFNRPQDIEYVYYALWSMGRCQVASVEPGTRDVLDENGDVVGTEDIVILNMDPIWNNILAQKGSLRASRPVYMENAVEFLDEEGEWYLDEGDGYVYYKPRTSIGEDMTTAEVVLPVMDAFKNPFITIKGTETNVVENVTFDNVSFAHVTWTRPNEHGHSDTQNNHIRDGGNDHNAEGVIDVSFANNINFTNCEFTKMGATAIRLLDGTKNSDIIGNEFYNLSAGAINIGVIDVVNASALRNPTETYKIDSIDFSNNYIHHVAIDYNSAAAVSAGYPSNTLISHNEICHIPYSGMHIGYGWDNRYTDPATGLQETSTNLTIDIKNNYIHDLFQGKIYDGGAIYTLGLTGGTRENPNEISGNYVENIGPGGAAYYNDQGSTYYSVHDNVADLRNTWGETDKSQDKFKRASNWCNVNASSTTTKHNLKWYDNYSTSYDNVSDIFIAYEGDTSSSFERFANRITDARAKEIIENAGIQPQYMNNFKHRLQNILSLDELTMQAGEETSHYIKYITEKNAVYKSNSIVFDIASDNPAIVEVTKEKIIAKAAGTAVVTYSAWENGVKIEKQLTITVE